MVRRILMVGLAAAALTAPAASAETPVRPGMSIHIALPDILNSCTLAFHYRATVADRVVDYASTAGHCLFVDPAATEEVHASGDGPVVFLTARSAAGAAEAGPRIGRVVYAAQQIPVAFPDPELPDLMDIGLIELDPGVVSDPAMCLFGGPTGLREEPLPLAETLHMYGAGNLTGFNRETGTTLLPGRTGVATSAPHPNVVVTSVASSGGDSGSPLVDAAGRAVALLSGPYQPRIAVSLARAEQALGTDFELRTAPLNPAAPPVGADSACAPPAA